MKVLNPPSNEKKYKTHYSILVISTVSTDFSYVHSSSSSNNNNNNRNNNNNDTSSLSRTWEAALKKETEGKEKIKYNKTKSNFFLLSGK